MQYQHFWQRKWFKLFILYLVPVVGLFFSGYFELFGDSVSVQDYFFEGPFLDPLENIGMMSIYVILAYLILMFINWKDYRGIRDIFIGLGMVIAWYIAVVITYIILSIAGLFGLVG